MRRGFLKDADIKPHLSRYWLTPAYEADFDDKVTDINEVYKQSPERAKQGQHTESIDDSTAITQFSKNATNSFPLQCPIWAFS